MLAVPKGALVFHVLSLVVVGIILSEVVRPLAIFPIEGLYPVVLSIRTIIIFVSVAGVVAHPVGRVVVPGVGIVAGKLTVFVVCRCDFPAAYPCCSVVR